MPLPQPSPTSSPNPGPAGAGPQPAAAGPRPAKTATRVEIYDQAYTIGSDDDAEYVRRLAERVDAKMRQVARETRVVDSLRVAVLAAINLADENESLRGTIERQQQQAAEKARSLNRSLEAVLGGER